MKPSFRSKSIVLAIILLLTFSFPTLAEAQGIIYGNTVPAGTTIDQDIVLIGQNISINGTVNGNVLVMGNQVEINGEINGSLILVGQNIGIGGTISGGTYAIGLAFELAPGAKLGRDLYVLAVGLASGNDAKVERDLFAISLDAGLNGSVGRNLHTAIGPLQLYNGLMRILGFEELTVRLHFELPQSAPNPDGVRLNNRYLPVERSRITLKQTGKTNIFNWGAWGINLAREWVVLVLLGLLAVWLIPNKLESVKMSLLSKPWKTTGTGLIVLVIAINLFVVGALLAALIFSIGLGLNYIQLWPLTIALWIISYALLAITMTVLWLFIVYGTKIIFVYSLFSWLLGKLSSGNWIKFVALLVGALMYVLLRSIPMIGWVFGILVTAAGMGMAWFGFQNYIKPKSLSGKPRKKKSA